MGMDVVAEGIETQEQLRLLKELGCPYGQGYLFSRPMPADQIEQVLAGVEPSFQSSPQSSPMHAPVFRGPMSHPPMS
jgi:predicted signal transduction protein with EAL and GGDEF domain